MNNTSNSSLDPWVTILPSKRIDIPIDFIWGVASSAFQAEGGEVNNDWVQLAKEGRVPQNPGNGFWEFAEDDMRLIAGLGFDHYRLSVEWSRVEPEPGRFDDKAIDRYKAICDAAQNVGITPWVNLFHFTHPVWFIEKGGFLDEANHADFLRYVERMGSALASHADHFHVANESMVYVLSCYRAGRLPPFIRDQELAYDMTRNVLALHAEGYRILKSVDPVPTVAAIEVYLDPRPEDPENPKHREIAERFDAWYHGTMLEALATGWVRLPGRDPEEIPHLKGAIDLYGFNYYSSVSYGTDTINSYSDHRDPPIDAMGRKVFPKGMEEGLIRISKALPDIPLLVTENGCPTIDENFRIRYVASHLAAIDRAREKGAQVNGYFHWTAVDNYEWLEGFSDARFGLISFDPETRERQVKTSGDWFKKLIATGYLDPESIP